MEKLFTTRRKAIFRGIKFIAAVALLPIASRTRAADLACVEADSESLRQSLTYTDPTPDPEKACTACGFFTPSGKGSCGPCMIMGGPVSGTAHCESWSKRSVAPDALPSQNGKKT